MKTKQKVLKRMNESFMFCVREWSKLWSYIDR